MRAACTAASPEAKAASLESRISQPWQNGHWNTECPQSCCTPGMFGGQYTIPVLSTVRRVTTRSPPWSVSTVAPSDWAPLTTTPERYSTVG